MSLTEAAASLPTDDDAAVSHDSDLSVLATIYEAHVNCAIWQRPVPLAAQEDAASDACSYLRVEGMVEVEHVHEWLAERMPPGTRALAEDVAYLADMYACLFGSDLLGIRLKTLDRAMCPRFHVDRLGCRLLTTYNGAGTEYLRNNDVDRSWLGRASTDTQYVPVSHKRARIQRVSPGAVLLCKGEGWPGNAGRGFVHRSPDPGGVARLMLSIDGVDNDR